jgi:hypothetical protein
VTLPSPAACAHLGPQLSGAAAVVISQLMASYIADIEEDTFLTADSSVFSSAAGGTRVVWCGVVCWGGVVWWGFGGVVVMWGVCCKRIAKRVSIQHTAGSCITCANHVSASHALISSLHWLGESARAVSVSLALLLNRPAAALCPYR